MAIYAISHEGVEALQDLSKRLNSAYNGLEEARNNLLNYINSISDGLGIYHKDILLLTRTIVIQTEQSREVINPLANQIIPSIIQTIEGFLAEAEGSESNGGGSTDDEWPDPPVKKKVLGHWR